MAGLVPRRALRKLCLDALAGVGDKSRQWEEWTGRAYHVRRRLRAGEQQAVGDAIDCRGSEEGSKRLASARPFIPLMALALAMEELGLGKPV